VSNCNDRNGRLNYARELSKHISVDIYGECGTKTCPRATEKSCFEMLKKEYKFYLAFENSNCRDYITEKFFINALRYYFSSFLQPKFVASYIVFNLVAFILSSYIFKTK
jgi:Glycosyltransferase family 10 (fucosyltransferase) C-term